MGLQVLMMSVDAHGHSRSMVNRMVFKFWVRGLDPLVAFGYPFVDRTCVHQRQRQQQCGEDIRHGYDALSLAQYLSQRMDVRFGFALCLSEDRTRARVPVFRLLPTQP